MHANDPPMVSTGADAADAPAALADLSFPSLSVAMGHYVQTTELRRAGPVERWSLIIALIGAGVGLIVGGLLDGKPGLYVTLIGLAVELSGFLVWFVLMGIREWPSFRSPFADHATQMEQEFHRYQAIVAALRQFPLEQRRRREAFMRDLRTGMHERLGLVTGSMEKLGIVPILLALYLQFKDWHWGDWAALSKISLPQGVLAFALLLAYAMFWHIIRLRIRVQSYERLLTEANRQDSVDRQAQAPYADPMRV